MPVPSTRSELSVTASSNSPGGSESPFPSVLKNYIRAALAFIAQNYADIQALQTSITTAVPAGVIVMWSGSASAIPSGYTLCDGSNGTPDLRNRFILGAGSTYSVGATGGSTSATTTDTQGAHTHTGATGSTTLTEAQIPSHTHSVPAGNYVTHGFIAGGGDAFSSSFSATTGATGGGAGHTHTISSDGGHSHTVTPNLPPYYALCFIQKT